VSIEPNDVPHNFMFDSDGQCPDLITSIDENISSNLESYKDFLNHFFSLLENNGYEAQKYIGSSAWDFHSCSHFIDTLVAHFWVQDSISSYNVLSHSIFFNTFFINMRFSDNDLCDALNTPLFEKWESLIAKLKSDIKDGIHRFEAKLFSAHDTNLIFFMNSLVPKDNLSCMFDFYNSNMKDKEFKTENEFIELITLMDSSECNINTNFASNIILEIYANEAFEKNDLEELFVKVFYNNKEIPSLSLSLDKFEDKLNDHKTSSFSRKCGNQDLNKGSNHVGLKVVAITSLIFMILALILVNVMLIINAKDESKQIKLYLKTDTEEDLIKSNDKELLKTSISDIKTNSIQENDDKDKNINNNQFETNHDNKIKN
jgi:hypothetical protein